MVRGVAFAFIAGSVCATMAHAGVVSSIQLRDRVGGENSLGVPTGFYLTGTGGQPDATNSAGHLSTKTGTFDFEYKNDSGGWTPLRTYALDVKIPIGFGENPSDTGGCMFNFTPITSINLGLGPMSGEKQRRLEVLWFHAFEASTQSRAGAAAFQMLVWDIAWDVAIDFNVGNIRFFPTSDPMTIQARALADAWGANITNGTWTERTTLLGLVGDCDGGPFLYPVPTPGTLALGALAGLVMFRRRRK